MSKRLERKKLKKERRSSLTRDFYFTCWFSTIFSLISGRQQANGKVPVTNPCPNYIERSVVAAKLSTEASTPLGYTSLFLSSMLSLPFVMQNIGVSPAWYIPLSTLLLSYLKSDKSRQDRKSALAVVSDYEVIIF